MGRAVSVKQGRGEPRFREFALELRERKARNLIMKEMMKNCWKTQGKRNIFFMFKMSRFSRKDDDYMY